MSAAAAAGAAPQLDAVGEIPDDGVVWSTLRGLALFAQSGDRPLRELIAAGLVERIEVPRDTVLSPPAHLRGALCIVASGQVSIGRFARGALGELDGARLPPGPLARIAERNLALFGEGELFNLAAIPGPDGEGAIAAFSTSRVVAVLVSSEAIASLTRTAPEVEQTIARALALTGARLRAITGVKHEILDFYVRHGLSIAGPTVRLRQLDLCIDCKQCEEACEDRHGAGRLVLGGFELGLLDFVFSCRTCTDARCLPACEHDAIRRDPRTGEIRIVEDRCTGCGLCAPACPYGAIDLVNASGPGPGPGPGREAPARRIANKCDHCAGHQDQACVAACPTGALIEIAPATLFRERPAPTGKRKQRLRVLPEAPFIHGIAGVLDARDADPARVRTRRLAVLLWVLGLGSVLGCAAELALRHLAPTLSASYRVLVHEGVAPEVAELAVRQLAGSRLALACGHVGTALLVLAMAYPLRRRLGWFRGLASPLWLDVHLMAGIVGPMYIALHSALRLTTWVSIPFWSMIAVVLSGVLGRYLYTLIPSLTGRHELSILHHRRTITELAKDHPAAGAYANEVMRREAEHARRAWEIGLLPLLLWAMADDLRRWWTRRHHRRALRDLAPRAIVRQIVRRVDRVVLYERRQELAPRGRALLRAWKRVHIPFSLALLVTMVIHIWIALAPG